MRCVRVWLSYVLAVYIILTIPLTAFAGVASGSTASGSDARPPMDEFDPVGSSGGFEFPVFNNTVPRANIYLTFEYYDMSNVVQRKTVFCDSNGWFNIERPADYARPIRFVISTESIPSSGKYKYQVACYTQGGGTNNIKSYKVGFGKQYKNAETLWEYKVLPGTSEWSQWYMSGIVDLGNVDVMEWSVYSDDFGFGFNGEIKIGFFKVSEDTPPDVSSPGTSSGDVDNDISNSMQQQVEQGDTIIELIKNTIQTISSQLTAFWDQLAGEFTNLYNKMNAHHAEDLAKVDEQINADRENTDQITNAVEKHGNFIIEGLKSLFIPSDEYFKTYFDDLYAWFSERFGFLSFPIDLLIRVVDLFVGSSDRDCVLTLPPVSIMGEELIPETAFNLSELLDSHFPFVLVAIRTVTSIMLIMAFVQLCESKWEEVMRN